MPGWWGYTDLALPCAHVHMHLQNVMLEFEAPRVGSWGSTLLMATDSPCCSLLTRPKSEEITVHSVVLSPGLSFTVIAVPPVFVKSRFLHRPNIVGIGEEIVPGHTFSGRVDFRVKGTHHEV